MTKNSIILFSQLSILYLLVPGIQLFFSPPSITKHPPPYSMLLHLTCNDTNCDVPILPLILECEAVGQPQPKYKWIKNEKEFQLDNYSTRILQQPNKGTLVISKPIDDDIGIYQCLAENDHGIALSNKVTVHGVFSHLTEAIQTKVVNVGDMLSLDCNSIIGYPNLKYVWIGVTSNSFITINNSRITTDPEGRLHFSNVTINDTSDGNFLYACSVNVSNEYKLGVQVNLKVLQTQETWRVNEPIEQYVSPWRIEVAKNDPLDLHCIFGGTPLPDIQWKKKNNDLPKDRYEFLNFGKTLHFNNAHFQDEGTYECVATNGIGKTQSRLMYVQVKERPYWTSEPHNTVKAENETVEFKCKATGIPKPLIEWFVNGISLNETSPNHRRTFVDSTTIRIENLSKSDAAVYQCNASNELGYAFKNFYINVQEKPRIINSSTNNEIARYLQVRLRCTAISDASLPLNISWYHDKKKIDYNEDTSITLMDDYSLHIKELDLKHTGTYTCIVSTEHDEASIDIPIKVQDIPNPPRLTGTKCQGFFAIIKWKPQGDNSAPILEFSVYYNTSFTPDSWLLYSNTSSTVHEIIVHGISPWTNSSYRIIARNKIGESHPSNPSEICTSPPDVPHRNPDGVTTNEKANSKNMTISWQPMPPIEHNGPGFFYRLYYRLNEPGTNWSEPIDIYNWTETSYDVENTGIYQSYLIKLEAHNKIGKSFQDATEEIGYSREEIPLESPNNFTLIEIIDSHTATFTWDPVSPESVRGYFRGYQIETWTHNENKKVKQILRPDETQTTFHGFVPFQLNHVQLRVINKKYEGPSTSVLSIQTPEDKPGPVNYFGIIARGSTSLFLKWAKPQDTNGIITEYKIYYAKIERTSVMELRQMDSFIGPNRTRIKLSGLEKNTRYRLFIAARTSQGEGSRYYTEANTGSIHEPPYKSNFTWRLSTRNNPNDNSTRYIKIIWLPAVDQYVGDNFFVQYRIKGEPQWIQSEIEHTSDSQEINLILDNLYEVKIVTVSGEYFTPSDVQEIKLPNLENF